MKADWRAGQAAKQPGYREWNESGLESKVIMPPLPASACLPQLMEGWMASACLPLPACLPTCCDNNSPDAFSVSAMTYNAGVTLALARTCACACVCLRDPFEILRDPSRSFEILRGPFEILRDPSRSFEALSRSVRNANRSHWTLWREAHWPSARGDRPLLVRLGPGSYKSIPTCVARHPQLHVTT